MEALYEINCPFNIHKFPYKLISEHTIRQDAQQRVRTQKWHTTVSIVFSLKSIAISVRITLSKPRLTR